LQRYLPAILRTSGFSIRICRTSIQAATRLFAPYGWGWLSDHTGERVKLLRYGATVALLSALGLWFDFGYLWLGAVLLVMFTHTSAMMPMSEAAMAHLVSQGGAFDAKRYGRVRLFGSMGFLATVLMAGAWFETLLAVVISVWMLPNLKETVPLHEEKVSVLPILRQAPVRWFFAGLFFHVLSHIGIYVFFSLYLDVLGYSKTTIGMLWAVSVVVEIFWFYNQSRWLPKFSLSAWMMVCAAIMVLRMGITASSASVIVLLVFAQMLHAFTFATHHTVCIAMLSHHFPGRLRGRGQALYTVIGYGFPGVLGGLAGGLISTKYGLAGVFYASIVTSLIALICACKVWQHNHSDHHL
jgi:MFS transporter, PPP family, 3-phenylpropionic acid transporter